MESSSEATAFWRQGYALVMSRLAGLMKPEVNLTIRILVSHGI